MAELKEMVQQIIKYSDGSETVINYSSLGSVERSVSVDAPEEELLPAVEEVEDLDEEDELPVEEIVEE